jgi:hypothetical protein
MLLVDCLKHTERQSAYLDGRVAKAGEAQADGLLEGEVVIFLADDLGDDFEDSFVCWIGFTRYHGCTSKSFDRKFWIHFAEGEKRLQAFPIIESCE